MPIARRYAAGAPALASPVELTWFTRVICRNLKLPKAKVGDLEVETLLFFAKFLEVESERDTISLVHPLVVSLARS